MRDHIYRELAMIMYPSYLFESTNYFSDTDQKVEEFREVCRKAGVKHTLCFFEGFKQTLSALRGETYNPTSFDSETFNENDFFKRLYETNYSMSIFFIFNFRMQLNYIFRQYEKVIQLYDEAKPFQFNAIGLPINLKYAFYYALSLAALYDRETFKRKKKYKKEIKKQIQLLKKPSEFAPANFLAMYKLLQAEYARINFSYKEADKLYFEAIAKSTKYKLRCLEAIACERFGEYNLFRKKTVLAKIYLRKSSFCFYSWGTTLKAEEVYSFHKVLFELPIDFQSTAIERRKTELLGISSFQTFLKLSNSLAGKRSWPELFNPLETALTNDFHLQKFEFIISRNGSYELFIKDKKQNWLNLNEAHSKVPIYLIQQTIEQKRPQLYSKKKGENIDSLDTYLSDKQTIHCATIPLVYQSEFIGVLYAERVNPFERNEINLFSLIGSQLAIFIRHCSLYIDLAEASSLLQNSNASLEITSKNLLSTVDERTRELNEKNRTLEKSLEQLKNYQKELVLQEKLCMIGGLTQKIAQDLKNPIKIVREKTEIASRMLNELQELAKKPAHNIIKIIEIIHFLKKCSKEISEEGVKADETLSIAIKNSAYSE